MSTINGDPAWDQCQRDNVQETIAALRQRVAELERLLQIDRLVFPLNYADGSLPVMLHRKDGTSIAVRDLDARLAAAEADAAKLKRRMAALIPLFQEARDAITAIPLAAAKLRGLRLDLADRMDEVGELARWEAIDAMRSGNGGSEGL